MDSLPAFRTPLLRTLRGALACTLALGACGPDATLPRLGQVDAPIINGTFAPTLVPLSSAQQLAIGYLSQGSGLPFCTATLIGADVILTAEHCVKDKVLADLRFGLGSAAAPRARFGIRRATVATWEFDTAVLQLTQNVVANVPEVTPLVVQRAPLPAWLVGASAEASGYHLIGGEEPRRRFGVLGITNLLDNTLVANGFGARGVCYGDSGGPLLGELTPGQTTLLGITLGGDTSCRDESYFTRLDALRGWLDAALASFAQSPSPTADGPIVAHPSCAKGDPNAFWPALGAIFAVGGRRRRKPGR